MTTIKVFMPTRTGLTGHTLLLRKSSDFTAVNGDGDALTESGSTGVFTADVEEEWTVSLYATILSSTDSPCWYGFVAVGGTEIVDSEYLPLIADIPQYGDEQRQIQQDKDEATKRVDVIITRTP